MIRLDNKEWQLIYYALADKKYVANERNDKVLVSKLDSTLRKIGVDGKRALRKGIFTDTDWWTVILLLPDHATDNFGQDTRLVHIKAKSIAAAVTEAQAKVKAQLGDPDMDPMDLFVISLSKGRMRDKVGQWNKLRGS